MSQRIVSLLSFILIILFTEVLANEEPLQEIERHQLSSTSTVERYTPLNFWYGKKPFFDYLGKVRSRVRSSSGGSDKALIPDYRVSIRNGVSQPVGFYLAKNTGGGSHPKWKFFSLEIGEEGLYGKAYNFFAQMNTMGYEPLYFELEGGMRYIVIWDDQLGWSFWRIEEPN